MKKLIQLDPKHYEQNSAFQYSQAKKLLELVEVKRDASVLDIGCGHGNIIAEISRMIPKGYAVGIDASKQMIDLAKEKFQDRIYKNLQYLHMNAENMSFPQSVFSLIICTNVLMWVRKPKKALDLMIAFLKPGGNIVILTYPTTTPYAILFEEVLSEFFPDLRDKSAVKTMLSPDQHKEVFENYGLKTPLFEVENTTFSYKDMDDFKNYVKGWLVCYAPLTDYQQKQFLNALCEKVCRKGFYSPTNPIVIPHQALKIIARKS